tara:strand:- start:1031 stop:2299 length:1269 start_codon:yes stop_codon:yes gene_type:complete
MYTGGVDIAHWSKLSKSEQKVALARDWYVYYSYRNPIDGKLKRQTNIKAGTNIYKNKRDRLKFLKALQRNLVVILEAGFNPYEDNRSLEQQFMNGNDIATQNYNNLQVPIKVTEINKNEPAAATISIPNAFDIALQIKKKVYKSTSFPNFKSNVNRFLKWLNLNGYKNKPINSITKKTIIDYLNSVLQRTSARTRNNTRADLSSLFQTLEDNDIIIENFVKKVNVLKSTPERHKTYSSTLLEAILKHLEENDSILLLFVHFIAYNYLRPIEVCRLKIKDIDLNDKRIYVRAKNSPVKTKIIPDILIDQLPDLSNLDGELFLFTPDVIGGQWETNEKDKRNYFSKRFKKVKDQLGLGKEYGLYSFRHTFITKLYKEFAKSLTPYETKSKLMLITGHKTMDALEKYLRNIDAVLPEDYSKFLKV